MSNKPAIDVTSMTTDATPIGPPSEQTADMLARVTMHWAGGCPNCAGQAERIAALEAQRDEARNRVELLEAAAADWAAHGRHLDDCGLTHGSRCTCGKSALQLLLPKADAPNNRGV